MHQKKPELQHNGKESNSCCISSDYKQKHSQIQSQSTPQQQNTINTYFTINQTHLTIETPPTQQTHQIHFQHEPISNNPSPSPTPTKTLLSSTTTTTTTTPHKRPIMTQFRTQTQTPSSSFNNNNKKFLSCSTSFAHKLYNSISHTCLLRFHFRFLIVISLPSLYFFISNPRRFFVFSLLSILAFSFTLLVSVNFVLPRFPSLRLLLARSLPNKFITSSSSSKHLKPVVWSIGSKPKTEKKPNSGSWVEVFSNGDVYEGEFHKGKCSGSGVYYYCMKGRYEGDWIDEKYDGYGVETWARGSRYRGQYRQGLRHGIGVYRFYTGDVYAGEWSNGQCHGCGIHTCEDGSRYVGEFKWGVKHGLGHYHFRNGDRYAGEYFADKMHGFGIYQFGNGHRYEGAWHEGRRQGLGMYTFRNGETQSGHWQNGVLDVLGRQNTHLGSPYAVSHSKVLTAVQEARRAAEKAYDLARVDERVNKAVAAANKAANAARVAAVKAVQKRMHHTISDDLPIPIV